MYTVIIISLLAILSNADDGNDDGCCECTDSLNGPRCNDACDANICPDDSYCCDVHWDWICADAACAECDDCHHEEYGYDYGSYSNWDYDYGDDYYGDYGYEDSWYSDYDQYGYDYDCDCNYICGGESPEEWEQSSYEEVPPCIVDNCGQQFQTCAFNDECVTGIENVVNLCYESDEDPIQCMDGLIADEANTGFISACGGDEECGTDLKSLGTCVANAANYGFCPEEVMKKLQLKSVVKSIKIKSRKLKRKSAALKSKSKRSRERRLRQRPRKMRRRRPSKLRSRKLRKSRRKLQSYGYESEYDYGSDYENPDYDYGCYCDCGEEDDEIPPCIIDNCSDQLFSCTDSEDCVAGIIGVEATCYEDNDNPEECMNELIQESNGQQAIELCNGNEEAAGNLQELGQCVANTFNSGDCGEPYKKLKIKALVRTTKKVRARKVASKQRRSRSLRRARAVRAQKLRRAKLGKRQRMKMKPRPRARARPRPQMRRQRFGKVQRARAERGKTIRSQMQRQRSMKLRGKKQMQDKLKQRRKLQSAGGDEACCDCTEAENGTGCSANPECDPIVCPLDSWCCKYSWDGICANGANNICNAADYWSWPTYSDNYNYNYYDYGAGSDYGFESFYDDSYYPQDSETDGSCCDCTSASGGPGCNAVCDNEVCGLDPYCCNNQWDSICSNGASNICQGYDYFGSSDDSWNDYNNWDSFGYNYDYSFYSPSGDFTYSDEPYYNSDEWSYSYYEPYNFDDSFNDWYDYGFSYSTYEPNYDSFGYDYSFYSPSGDFTWSDQPYWYSDSYSYYPPLKQRKARLSKRTGARSRRAMDMAQKRRRRQRGRKLRNRARRQSKRSLQEDSNIN